MPIDNSAANKLEQSMEELAEAVDRLADGIDASNRQTGLTQSGGRTTTATGSRSSGGGAGGGFGASLLGGSGGGALIAGVAAQQSLRFGKAAAKAGFSSFVSSRGSIGFEGAVTNGTIAALRLIPGGDSIVDRRLGPAERAIARARGVLEPIARGGGLRNPDQLKNVFNGLKARFERQEKRAQNVRDLAQKSLQESANDAAPKIKEDLKKVGEQMAEGFLERLGKGDTAALTFAAVGGIPGFVIPRIGGK